MKETVGIWLQDPIVQYFLQPNMFTCIRKPCQMATLLLLGGHGLTHCVIVITFQLWLTHSWIRRGCHPACQSFPPQRKITTDRAAVVME
jgi:hypothetical protein